VRDKTGLDADLVLSRCAEQVFRRPGRFLWRVIRDFRHNQGVLLSGAVAYYMLLSIVPLLALVLVGLSQIYPTDALLTTLDRELQFLIPSGGAALTEHFAEFLEHKRLIGWVGIGILVFFSTMAFTVLENAMSVIFHHRVAINRRHFLVSAVIPFLFIVLIGAGLLLITLISGALQAVDEASVTLFGSAWHLQGIQGVILYLLGVGGIILLLTALYLVMPVGRIAVRHALIGGVVAAVLWELIRHLLVWYFSTLSFVNVVYGSLATAVIVLLSFEAAAIILLFGAQVIAEFERCGVDADDDRFHT
jgi:YihY family inner membrane protein